jgi:hypothetical protein
LFLATFHRKIFVGNFENASKVEEKKKKTYSKFLHQFGPMRFCRDKQNRMAVVIVGKLIPFVTDDKKK